jgi:hypothetical protein
MAWIELHPLLLPALLIGGAVGAALIAFHRSAGAKSGMQRSLVAAYVVLALVAAAQSGWLVYDRGARFWGARWDESTQRLRLDRAFPMPDVQLEPSQVKEITEVLSPTYTLSGLRPAAEYEVKTKNGDSFLSGPIFTESERHLMLTQLEPVSGGRLVRFLVGRVKLP